MDKLPQSSSNIQSFSSHRRKGKNREKIKKKDAIRMVEEKRLKNSNKRNGKPKLNSDIFIEET